MKLPRDLHGDELIRGQRRVGYERVRQKGDRAYLTTYTNGEHHVAVPLHKPLKVGTLSSILAPVGQHLDLDREELLRRMKVA